MSAYTARRTFVDPANGCRLYKAGAAWPGPGAPADEKQAEQLLAQGLISAAPAIPAKAESAPRRRKAPAKR